MCSIWKKKKDREFSPSELAIILEDSLFKNLNYIGVSGGEPTLREDLPEIFQVIAQKQPLVSGTGIITNAISEDHVIKQIEKSAAFCLHRGIRFNLMVSLDGIGDIHDKIRGYNGNYKHAVNVIRYFKEKNGIFVTIGCTITKDNVWFVDDVLQFCIREGITGRFRIAEFIDRLYNHEQTEVIRNFTSREKYHLGLFFYKLERLEHNNSPRKRTYRNIRKMLLENAKRSTKCHWQNTAVTLDCRGQLLYCAPHSSILGGCLEKSALHLYKRNIFQRKRILKENCDDCIHDYNSTETIQEWLEDKKEKYWRAQFSVDRMVKIVESKKIKKPYPKENHMPTKFLIIGWYGTETTGDKAILAEIIFILKDQHPDSHITLASIHPSYSQWTLKELALKNIDIIPTYSIQFMEKIKEVDQVIMGGGPLMHLEALGLVLAAFFQAKQLGKKTQIYGCGIGPLEKHSKYEKAVKLILNLTDNIELRDSASVNWASEKIHRYDIKNIGDPAVNFVKSWKKEHPSHEKKAYLNLYLRDWTWEYQSSLTKLQFNEIKEKFELELSQGIYKLSENFALKPRFYSMHHFTFGGDDREFNQRFVRRYLQDLKPYVEIMPLTIDQILESMQEASLCLCMRFHSILFADTLKVPFIAIDYTNGGKIFRYLADQNKLKHMHTLIEIAEGKQWTIPSLMLNEEL